VYAAFPWFIDGATFDLAANLGNGAVAYVHLADTEESRLTVPAVQGEKIVHYEVAVIVAYQFLIPSTDVDVTISEDEWVDPLDVILQGIKDRIHADPQLGAPGVVFLAAQTPRSMRVHSEMPRRLPGKILSWHAVEFQLTEIITA
jgi:hypothetical protein